MDQTLQVPRSVANAVSLLKVVHTESQENGQKEAKRGKFEEEEEEDEVQGSEDRTQANEEKVGASPPAAMETQPAPDTSHDVENNAGNESLPVCCVMFHCDSSDRRFDLSHLYEWAAERWMSNVCPHSLSLLLSPRKWQ